jgi:uncharacterized SAM-binding protein YcdF (DUF218 family)
VIVAGFALLGLWTLAAWALDLYGRGRTGNGNWDAIIVAGARVWSDGEPSLSMLRRTRRGADSWKHGQAPLLVLTGGVGDHPPAEATVMAAIAERHGVPRSAMLLEAESRTTEENARNAHRLLGARRVLVVTDAYHVLRCELIYSRYFDDFSVVGVDVGWRPPVRGAMREVFALGWHGLSRALARD